MTPVYLQDRGLILPPLRSIAEPFPRFVTRETCGANWRLGTHRWPPRIGLLEDMLMIREMEEMIVTVRSGAYEPLAGYNYRGPTHVSIGQEGASVGACSALVLKDYITSTHRGHGDSLARGLLRLRLMTTSSCEERVPASTATTTRNFWNRPSKTTSIAPSPNCSARTMVLQGARRRHAHCRLHRRPPGGQRHRGRQRAHRHGRGHGGCATCRMAVWCAASPGDGAYATAWCWNR